MLPLVSRKKQGLRPREAGSLTQPVLTKCNPGVSPSTQGGQGAEELPGGLEGWREGAHILT